MRFFLGLCLGAFAVVFLADHAEFNPRSFFEQASKNWASHATPSESTFSEPETIEAPSDQILSEPSSIQEVANHQPLVDTAQVFEDGTEAITEEFVPEKSAVTEPSPEELFPEERVDSFAPDLPSAAPLQPTDQFSVWVPFYSEASAQGFASHLAATLDRRFLVEKRSAGQYVIVCPDATHEEWQTIKTALVAIIGEPTS